MGTTEEDLKAMAKHLAKGMGIATGRKVRRLESVDRMAESGAMNALQRDVLYGRIRDLGGMYGLSWLIRQECMHVNGIIECLADVDLTALLAKMDRGVEAVMDGVAFAEVGLVKGATLNWVA